MAQSNRPAEMKHNDSPRIRSVVPAGDMVLFVEFENNEARRFDASPFAGRSAWFSELRDPDYFERVRIVWKGSGIEWPNGQDLSRDTLYLESEPVNPEEASVSEAAGQPRKNLPR